MDFLTQLGLVALLVLSPVAPGVLAPSPESSDNAPTLATNFTAPWPIKQPGAVAPIIEAKSALLVDLPSGSVLFSKNPEARLPIASLTKLMTALLAVEHTQADEVVTIPELQFGSEESLMGLRTGDQLHVEDLLAGALIVSGNDAATLLAQKAGGSTERFVGLMNERAVALGLTDTHFDNPTGYGAGENISSARDLVTLSRVAMEQVRIRNLVGLKELKVTALNLPVPTSDNPNPTKPNEYDLHTTDQLLGSYLPIAGLKTGTSDTAGQSLISELATADRKLLAIVLNSPSRFQENKSMLDWALRAYRW